MTDTMREALAFYADDANWRQNGPLDPNSANFTGGPARAALAAAPQPAPVDREALARQIWGVLIDWHAESDAPAYAIADALLARGLRLPGVVSHENALCDTQAPLPITDDTQAETMAWAVVGKDGRINSVDIYSTEDGAKDVATHFGGGIVVRVAIRVVEGGDDAA